jgi:hypothetical protein
VVLYNQQLPQSALGSDPLAGDEGMAQPEATVVQELKPQLFRKQPCHLPGCDG